MSTRTPTRGPTLRTGAARHSGGMSINMYLINVILVLMVIRQIREHSLDLRALAVPVLAVAAAAVFFLHSVPGGGNDIALELLGVSAGAAMGAVGGLATRLSTPRMSAVASHGSPASRKAARAASTRSLRPPPSSPRYAMPRLATAAPSSARRAPDRAGTDDPIRTEGLSEQIASQQPVLKAGCPGRRIVGGRPVFRDRVRGLGELVRFGGEQHRRAAREFTAERADGDRSWLWWSRPHRRGRFGNPVYVDGLEPAERGGR